VVVTADERDSHRLQDGRLSAAQVITVPKAIYRDIRGGDLPAPLRGAPPFGGHILFTSGTTGLYKKVLQTGRTEEKRNEARVSLSMFDKDTVAHVLDLPLDTGVGFRHPSAVWHAGGCVLVDQRPDRLKRFLNYRMTHAILVPPSLNALPDESRNMQELACAKAEFVAAGGFVSLKTAERLVGEMKVKLSLQFAMTEIGNPIMKTEFRGREDLYWNTPVPGRIIRVVNEHGDECAPGEEGRLGIPLTDIDSTGYLDDDAASARFFADGVFYPGDLVVRREDGRIRLLGRADDVLNIQGSKTAAAPLEQAIQRLLGVNEVVLLSGLNAAGQDELVVVVESDRKLSQSERTDIAGRLKHPRIRFMRISELPRVNKGMRKVQRSLLWKIAFEKPR